MKFHSPMIIVSDMERSKEFYTSVLHEKISLDLGAYVVMDGFSMMARETWNEDTNDGPMPAKAFGHNFELYFEEERIDDFVADLNANDSVKVFQPLTEAPWGQRMIRILDPDNHVIEVAESIEEVVSRLLASGMTEQEASEKSMMPIEFVRDCNAKRLSTQ